MQALQRVQRSRSIGLSCAHSRVERAEPPLSALSCPVDREIALRRQFDAVARDRVISTVTASCGSQRVRPVQRRHQRADDQHLSVGFVGDARHRLGIGQRGRGEQRRDLRRRARRFGRPAGGLADVDEADRRVERRLSSATSPSSFALLRAGDDHVAGRAFGEAGQFLLAHRGVHGSGSRASSAAQVPSRRAASCRCRCRGAAFLSAMLMVMLAWLRFGMRLCATFRQASADGSVGLRGSRLIRRSAGSDRDLRRASFVIFDSEARRPQQPPARRQRPPPALRV